MTTTTVMTMAAIPRTTISRAAGLGTRRWISQVMAGPEMIARNAANSTGTRIGRAAQMPVATTMSEARVARILRPVGICVDVVMRDSPKSQPHGHRAGNGEGS